MQQSEVTLRQAHRLWALGDIEGARTVCQAVCADRPRDWKPFATLARIEIGAGEFCAASANLAEAAHRDAPPATLHGIERELAGRQGVGEIAVETPGGDKPDVREKVPAEAPPTEGKKTVDAVSELYAKLKAEPATDISDQAFFSLRSTVGSQEFVKHVASMLAIAPENFAVRLRHAGNLVEQGKFDAAVGEVDVAYALHPARKATRGFLRCLVRRARRHKIKIEPYAALQNDPPDHPAVLASYITRLSRSEALGATREAIDSVRARSEPQTAEEDAGA
ncbi:MAG: hypothetical protein AAGB11_07075 [Pseudomonadota bacterium]